MELNADEVAQVKSLQVFMAMGKTFFNNREHKQRLCRFFAADQLCPFESQEGGCRFSHDQALKESHSTEVGKLGDKEQKAYASILAESCRCTRLSCSSLPATGSNPSIDSGAIGEAPSEGSKGEVSSAFGQAYHCYLDAIGRGASA